MAGLFLLLFFSGSYTRKLAVALLPFIVFAISYDWMRVWPNYEVNPIDVQGLYEAEKSLFGITVGGQTLIPYTLDKVRELNKMVIRNGAPTGTCSANE